VLFSPPHDLRDIDNQAIRVGAVEAVESLQTVQIKESGAVKDKVVAASNFPYSVEWEASDLIDRDQEVQQQERDEAEIDQRCGQYHEDPRVLKVSPKGEF